MRFSSVAKTSLLAVTAFAASFAVAAILIGPLRQLEAGTPPGPAATVAAQPSDTSQPARQVKSPPVASTQTPTRVLPARSALPSWDAGAYCRGLLAGGSASAEKYCVETEQDAYRGLGRSWLDFPVRAREVCVDLFSGGAHGSYSALEYCVEMEADALAAMPRFVP